MPKKEKHPMLNGKGYVERLGKFQYLMILHDTKNRGFTFPAIDPSDAKRQAEELCDELGINLLRFTISPEIKSAYQHELDDFANKQDTPKETASLKYYYEGRLKTA